MTGLWRFLHVDGGGDTSTVRRMTAPLDRSATWPYEEGEPGRFSYARADHPTGVACEEALGALDGGHALLYPSGMGAVTTVVLTTLRPGATIALAAGAYYGHRVLFDHLAPWGVNVVEFDQIGPPPDGADLILVEAPSNPLLTMPDLEAAAAHPAPVVCDATIATPLRLRPLEHGCDVVLHSATKVLSGHDDVIAGVTVTRDAGLRDRLHTTRRLAGIVASGDTAWLVHRGLATLPIRLDRQEASARLLAERLAAHPAVEAVRYPGISFLLSFDVADGKAAGRVERRVRTIENATSLGGVRTKLEARHRWEGDRIPEGLLRLSVGVEDADALWADLERALATV
jgi:cystathionine gamma-synthase